MNTNDTICAIATAQGGAIGIIRVSGTDAIVITEKIFIPVNSRTKSLLLCKPYTVHFGHIKNTNNEIVDEVLVTLFHAPHSYTGENSVEISCHGSVYILQQVMQLLIANGCRHAMPGEYTQRAFLNGKMDLSQAEAVADLIASKSRATHRIAMNQMRGAFSKELSALREKLLHLTSLMELELDFSDHEELEFADRNELKSISENIERIISTLTKSFKLGNAIKNGIPVAIIGETNAGKSTLLNTLVGDERSIVSDIHGTTRDVIEDVVNINGFTFRFIDTAGIRETNDTIEQLGIERTYKKINQAEIILLVIDATEELDKSLGIIQKVVTLCQGKNLIIVYNKSDLAIDKSLNTDYTKYILLCKKRQIDSICISAKNGYNIEKLKERLVELTNIRNTSNNEIIITNVRHFEALSKALTVIHRINEGLNINIPCDLLCQDLRNCLFLLSEITGGEITTDEVLGNIFKNFCIGK